MPASPRLSRALSILNAVALTGFGLVLLLIAQAYGDGSLPLLAALLIACAALAAFPATARVAAVALTLVALGAIAMAAWRDLMNLGDVLPFVLPAAVQWLAVSLRARAANETPADGPP